MPETSAVNESFLTQHERQTDGHRYVAHFIMAPRWVGIALMTTDFGAKRSEMSWEIKIRSLLTIRDSHQGL